MLFNCKCSRFKSSFDRLIIYISTLIRTFVPSFKVKNPLPSLFKIKIYLVLLGVSLEAIAYKLLLNEYSKRYKNIIS